MADRYGNEPGPFGRTLRDYRNDPHRNFVEVFPQTPIVAAPADAPLTIPAALLSTGANQAHLHDPDLLAEWHRTLAKTIAVDFDGTLHPYTAGWTGSVPENEPPLDGARDFLARLRDLGYEVVVFSVRADHPEGKDGIIGWLARHHLLDYVREVTHLKPPALAYVDDRAVPYRGSWPNVLYEIEEIARHDARGPGNPPADPPPGA